MKEKWQKRRTWTEDQDSSLLSLGISDGVGSDGGDEIGVQLVGPRDGVEDLNGVGVEASALILRLESLELFLRLTLSTLASSSSLEARSILDILDDVLQVVIFDGEGSTDDLEKRRSAEVAGKGEMVDRSTCGTPGELGRATRADQKQ